MSELTQFDPKTLEQKVVETIRTTFGALIPDDVWQKKVEDEINAFFDSEQVFSWETKDKTNSWNSAKVEVLSLKISPFRQMVWTELQKICIEKIQAVVNNPEFSVLTTYDNGDISYAISDLLDKKLEELAPKMAAAMFKNMFAEAVNMGKINLMNDIRNNSNYGNLNI